MPRRARVAWVGRAAASSASASGSPSSAPRADRPQRARRRAGPRRDERPEHARSSACAAAARRARAAAPAGRRRARRTAPERRRAARPAASSSAQPRAVAGHRAAGAEQADGPVVQQHDVVRARVDQHQPGARGGHVRRDERARDGAGSAGARWASVGPSSQARHATSAAASSACAAGTTTPSVRRSARPPRAAARPRARSRARRAPARGSARRIGRRRAGERRRRAAAGARRAGPGRRAPSPRARAAAPSPRPARRRASPRWICASGVTATGASSSSSSSTLPGARPQASRSARSTGLGRERLARLRAGGPAGLEPLQRLGQRARSDDPRRAAEQQAAARGALQERAADIEQRAQRGREVRSHARRDSGAAGAAVGSSAPARNRTWNLRIKSPLLCQLSYKGAATIVAPGLLLLRRRRRALGRSPPGRPGASPAAWRRRAGP